MSETTRVFIAGTVDDLREVRNEVGKFLQSCGHTAERWETGSIFHDPVKFDPGGAVSSAVRAVGEADIAVVIIGKEYGFKPENAKGFSATELEYESAKNKAVPIYVFVVDSVFDEHTKLKGKMATDTVSLAEDEVHRFIDRALGDQKVGIALVFPFGMAADIVACLQQQWSALFGRYLRDKRRCTSCSGRMLRDSELRARRGAQAIEPNRLFSFVRDATMETGGAEIDAFLFAQCVARSTDFESFCGELSQALGREFRVDRLLRKEAIQEYQRAREILAAPSVIS